MHTIAKYGPEPDIIYLFSDGTGYSGDFNGYDGPEEACKEVYELYFSSLEITMIAPLLSTTERDVRNIVPDVYSHVNVVAIDMALIPTTISNSWDGLWDGLIDTSLGSPVFGAMTTTYWTGSTASGTLATNNCDNWSDTTQQGVIGGGSYPDNWWISYQDHACNDNTISLICVGY